MTDRSNGVQRARQAIRRVVREVDFMRGRFLQTGCSAPASHILLESDGGEVAGWRPADGRNLPLSLAEAGERQAAEVDRLARDPLSAALALQRDAQCGQPISGIEHDARAIERW